MVNLICMMVFAILFFIFFAYLKPKKLNTVISIICFLLFLGTIVFSIANEAYHYGMKPVNISKNVSLVSTNPKVEGVAYKTLGTDKKEKIYLYRTNNKQTKPLMTQADSNTFNDIKYVNDDKKPMLKETKTVWQYRNHLIRFFFSYPSNEEEIIKTNYTFYIPKNWKVYELNMK